MRSLTRFTSTRSNKSPDAHRDFDDFDADEELRRFRAAVAAKRWQDAAVLTANLDEWLSRGGPLPVAWLGPACMQTPDDQRTRHAETAERAAKLSGKARADVIWGYAVTARLNA